MAEEINNQQVAVRDQRPLPEAGFTFLPQTWEQLYSYAKEIANTEFVPSSIRGKPGAVLAAWQTGKEVGLPPMASLSSIAIINGRPSIHSNGYWALITSHPLCEWFTELPPHEALEKGYGECTIKRRGNPHPIIRRFTMAEAKTADLIGKDNWKKYPGDMLQNRARHRCGDDAIPEACQGLLPADVARDLEPIETTVVNERVQIAAPKPKNPEAKKETAHADQPGGEPADGAPAGNSETVAPADSGTHGPEPTESAKPEEKPVEEKPVEEKKPRQSRERRPNPEERPPEPDVVAELRAWIKEAPIGEVQSNTNRFTQTFNKIPDDKRIEILREY